MSGSNSLPLYSSLPSQLRARYACSEFNLVQSISDPSVCEACDAGAVGSLPPLIGLAAAALLAVGVFVGIAARSPGAMRRWVSTTVILITHVQTVSILSSLHLQWPVWVKRVTATLSFDVVSLPSSSCLFNSGGEAVFPVAALAVCGGVLVVDMLFVCATLSCRHEETAARYEVVLSLVFSLQLTTSWRHVSAPSLLHSCCCSRRACSPSISIGVLPPSAAVRALESGSCRGTCCLAAVFITQSHDCSSVRSPTSCSDSTRNRLTGSSSSGHAKLSSRCLPPWETFAPSWG